MQFRVLGPVELAVEGRRVALPSERQRALLAALLAHPGETLSTDRLIDAVWDERPPASARQSLHSHISRLRRAFAELAAEGDGPVETEAEGYRLELQDHDLDAARFERLVAGARAVRESEPRRAVALFDEALGLWRGAAFGGLATRQVVRAAAAQLDQLRDAAVAERVDALLALGDHAELLGELEATVAQDPLAERPHGQLMLALYRSGRQADALATYRELQGRLRDELGVDASPDLQRMHEAMLRHAPKLATIRGSPDPPEAVVDRPGGGQPAAAALGELFGREADTEAVASLLRTVSLVTLTGPGGVGKTRLAMEVAAGSGERYDGVAVCRLAGLRDPDRVAPALVDALGIQHRGYGSAEDTLVTALGNRHLLLVLDNCEHLLDAVAQLITRIREHCPHVAVLATSREHLHLSEERVWEVTPLPVPRADAGAAEVADTPAGALFCARAWAVEPSFGLTDGNAAAIAKLCRRLDGIPLALELAAARIRALALDDLADRIDRRFELLTGGPYAGRGRHRTLHAMVEWSYGLLTAAEARLFDRLSVFAGSFSLDAAEQVAAGDPVGEAEVAGLLAELVDKSLVDVERADGRVRYRLLETLRAYGARCLEEIGDGERTRRAHAGYHVGLVEELAPRLRGAEEGDALARLDAAIDDVHAAQARLLDAAEVDGALRLPAALHDYLTFRPRAEMYAWTEQALELPGASRHPAHPGAMATAARGALYRGHLDHARDLAQAALGRVEPVGLVSLRARFVLTSAALYGGDLEEVLRHARRRIVIADELGEAYHRALGGVSCALAHVYRGDAGAAVQAAADARDAAEASGSDTARAWARYASGETLLETNPAEAADLLERAVNAARRVGLGIIEGVALVSLASVRGRLGDCDLALSLFRDTVAHWRRLGDYTHQLTTLRNLVELLVRVGADEAAAVLHGAVIVGATPSFGAEAGRLDAAWARVEERLGPARAGAAAERGRRMTPAQMVDEALAWLDALLDERAAPEPAHPLGARRARTSSTGVANRSP